MKSQPVSFAAIQQAVTMEAVLRRYRVQDLAAGRAGRYRGRCPLHQGEGREAFHVDLRRKIFHCFSCGAGGDVLDLVAIPRDKVVVVEGFFDCLRVSQAGVENMVALLGTELYEHPAQLLRDRFRWVLLMLDGDEAGRRAQARVAARLRDRCGVRVIGLPEGAQPDQLPEWRLREWIDSATVGAERMLRG